MTRPPSLAALGGYVEASGHTLRLQVPARHWAWRGVALALALPPLFALLGVLASLGEDGVAAPSVALAGAGGMAFVLGLCVALLSPLLSARTRVTLDFAQGTLARARSPYPVPLASLARLRLARTSSLSSFLELRAERAGAPELTLLGPLAPKQAPEAAALATWLGERLGIAVDTSSLETTGGAASSSDQLAGVLCYLPVQGVFIVASLYFLFAAKRRPFVRFCAIQSLSQLVFSLFVLAVILLGLGVPLGLSEPSPAQTALIVALAVALGAFWLWNFGAHAYACYSAYKGRLWVMPWLGPFVRRFLP